MWSRRLGIVFLGALGAWFAAGVFGLLRARYERGDVYPPYSSLRADPLGARALHDALRALPELDVRRSLDDPGRLEGGRGLTVLILGVDESQVRHGDDSVRAYESLAISGARVVVALSAIDLAAAVPTPTPPADPPTPGPEPESDGSPERHRPRSVAESWGFDLETLALPKDDDDQPIASRASRRGAGPGPASIVWHSPLCFRDLARSWEVIYERAGRPVVIERPFGGGRLVLASDSYFASNEALRENPHADFLLRLIGAPRRIVIDETHLGIAEAPGIVTLARRYRLAPAAAVLAVLAVLFVWRAATPLVPRAEDAAAGAPVIGRDAAEGFIRLLQRGIRPAELPRACVEEWRRSFGKSRAVLADELNRIRMEHRDPVEVCRDLHRLVAQGKGDHER